MNGKIVGTEARRWVALDGAFNFRDLGGYGAGEQTQVAWGSVFRSDGLHYLSAGDLDVLTGLGIDRVIDLRSPDEIRAVGRGALASGPIEYVDAPVIPSTSGEAIGAPPGESVAERYLWYLDVGSDALVHVFETLAQPDRGAAVFHCAAGKDRTGVAAALLLALLGVGDDDIAADYALSDRVLPEILERLAADPVHGAAVAKMPDSRRAVRAESMSGFLRLLGERYGGARRWAEQAGVTPSSIDTLRSRLRVPSR